jgi:hypothetical protein
LGDADSIPDVVSMPMSDKDIVRVDLISRHRSKDVVGEEWVDKDAIIVNVETEG